MDDLFQGIQSKLGQSYVEMNFNFFSLETFSRFGRFVSVFYEVMTYKICATQIIVVIPQ